MPESIRKIWLYLLPLALLGVLAYYGGDLDIKNPFSSEVPAVSIESDSSEVVDSALVNSSLASDTLTNLDDKREIEDVKIDHDKKWRLVIGSLREKNRAEKLLAQSNNPEGSIVYIDRLATYRVVYGSYSDIQSAQNQITELEERFSDAWLVYF